MKKKFLLLLVFLFVFKYSQAENLTIYSGTTSVNTQYFGATAGGDILDFLQMQIDFFKYLKKDQSLYSSIPGENRGDFLGISFNFALNLPIHLIPSLDKYDYIQPYILVGYGFGVENLSGDYMRVPDKDGKTGIFSKMRQFDSYGLGLVVMVTPQIGFKVDYRSVNISALEGMGYPSRKFNRFSFGVSFGSKKKTKKVRSQKD